MRRFSVIPMAVVCAIVAWSEQAGEASFLAGLAAAVKRDPSFVAAEGARVSGRLDADAKAKPDILGFSAGAGGGATIAPVTQSWGNEVSARVSLRLSGLFSAVSQGAFAEAWKSLAEAELEMAASDSAARALLSAIEAEAARRRAQHVEAYAALTAATPSRPAGIAEETALKAFADSDREATRIKARLELSKATFEAAQY